MVGIDSTGHCGCNLEDPIVGGQQAEEGETGSVGC